MYAGFLLSMHRHETANKNSKLKTVKSKILTCLAIIRQVVEKIPSNLGYL